MDDEIPFYYENLGGDSFVNKLKRIATSSLLFVVSYVLSNLLLQLLIARISKMLKYSSKFSYNQVRVYPWDYHYWNRTSIVLIYLLSPFICLVIGLFIFNLLRVYSSWSNVFRLFFFWLSVALVNMVFTHALLAPLGSPADRNNGLYQTFAVVGIYLWINPTLIFMVSIGALVASLSTGMLVRKEVMRYSFSKKLIKNKKGMDSLVIQIYVLPVLMGCIPILLLCTQAGFFTTVMELANLGVIAIGIFLMNSIGIATVRCNKKDVLNHIPVVEFAICTALWLGVFLFLR